MDHRALTLLASVFLAHGCADSPGAVETASDASTGSQDASTGEPDMLDEGGSDTTAGSPSTYCLEPRGALAWPADQDLSLLTDDDGDGLSEAWFVDRVLDGQITTTVTVYAEVAPGQWLSTEPYVLGADVDALAHVDGDDIRDVIVEQPGVTTWWQRGRDLGDWEKGMLTLIPPEIGDGSFLTRTEANGDRRIDYLERTPAPAPGVRVHLGDGTGGTSPSETAWWAMDETVRPLEPLGRGWYLTELVPLLGPPNPRLALLTVSSSGNVTGAPLGVEGLHDFDRTRAFDAFGDPAPELFGLHGDGRAGQVDRGEGGWGEHILGDSVDRILVQAADRTDELYALLLRDGGEDELVRWVDGGWEDPAPLLVDPGWLDTKTTALWNGDAQEFQFATRRPEGWALWSARPCSP